MAVRIPEPAVHVGGFHPAVDRLGILRDGVAPALLFLVQLTQQHEGVAIGRFQFERLLGLLHRVILPAHRSVHLPQPVMGFRGGWRLRDRPLKRFSRLAVASPGLERLPLGQRIRTTLRHRRGEEGNHEDHRYPPRHLNAIPCCHEPSLA
jgi:hypothetical protein